MQGLQGFEWEQPDLKVRGLSLAGSRTSFVLPELQICFDVAMGLPWQLSCKKFFLTHGHLDHAGGIPFVVSQKAMSGHPMPTIYVPLELQEPLQEIMKIWGRVEKHKYQFQIETVVPGNQIEINKFYLVEPFATLHRVNSQGYTLLRRSKKLRPEYAGLPSAQLGQLKRQGVEIDETLLLPIFSFTGDTQIEFLDLSPQVKNTKYLFVEATFLDEAKSVQSARDWGHIHLDEIIARKDELTCEKVVIIHISGRYSTKQAEEILRRKLDEKDLSRFEIFQGR